MPSDREIDIRAFLETAGWSQAVRKAVTGDASTRRYERLDLDGKKAVLMDAPKGAEAPSEPEGASVKERQALGYNALARLAGPNPEAFACIASELAKRGFSAPEIIAADLDKGFMLLEDLGNNLYAAMIEKDTSKEAELYEVAVECLAAIYRSSFPANMDYQDADWRVREYDEAALLAEVDLCLNWYIDDLGYDISSTAKAAWQGIWTKAFKCLNVHAPGLALRDFHAENIFWLPERQATARVGLIDFQDALFAHPAYDLVSLLEDARRDVSKTHVESLIDRFCMKAGLKNDDKFQAAYAVMGAQRNAKILGIFVRLAERDGKPHYRDLIPRVRAHFKNNLAQSELSDLRDWMQAHAPKALA